MARGKITNPVASHCLQGNVEVFPEPRLSKGSSGNSWYHTVALLWVHVGERRKLSSRIHFPHTKALSPTDFRFSVLSILGDPFSTLSVMMSRVLGHFNNNSASNWLLSASILQNPNARIFFSSILHILSSFLKFLNRYYCIFFGFLFFFKWNKIQSMRFYFGLRELCCFVIKGGKKITWKHRRICS